MWATQPFAQPGYPAAHGIRLAELLVDLLTDAGAVGEHAAAGAGLLVVWLELQVPEVGLRLFEAGVMQTLVATAAAYPAAERCSGGWGRHASAGVLLWPLAEMMMKLEPEVAVRAALDTGLVEMVFDNLAAIKAGGSVENVCPMLYWHSTFHLRACGLRSRRSRRSGSCVANCIACVRLAQQLSRQQLHSALHLADAEQS